MKTVPTPGCHKKIVLSSFMWTCLIHGILYAHWVMRRWKWHEGTVRQRFSTRNMMRHWDPNFFSHFCYKPNWRFQKIFYFCMDVSWRTFFCLQWMYYSFHKGFLAQTLITDNSKTESVSKLIFLIYSFCLMMYHSNFLEEDLRTHESPLGTFLQAGTL